MQLLLYRAYYSQNNRDTYLNKEISESEVFISIEPEVGFIKYDFDLLKGYESDKIKFMTKVEINEQPIEGIRSRIKIAKEPIYAKQDTIIFLLIFEWFPNSLNSIPKTRKGSFVAQKQLSLKVRFQKAKIQQQQLISIVYLLSEKIYIDQKHIDAFLKIVEHKHETTHQQINCLTVIINGLGQKRNLANLASTMDETKGQYYWYDNALSERNQRSLTLTMRNQNMMGKVPMVRKRSSKMIDQSPKTSQMSRSGLEDGLNQNTKIQFNLKKARSIFSTVQYLLTEDEVTTQMIVYHLTDSQNILSSGFRLQTLQEMIEQWPRYKSFPRLQRLNKDKIINNLIQQATSNYQLMIEMELEQINSKNVQKIYQITNEFHSKVTNEFVEAIKEYVNEPDYNQYIDHLEVELLGLESELLNNYAQTRKEYGSRTIKNFQKKNYKNSLENYTLMKIIGKEQINNLEMGYKMYKQIIEETFDQGFKQFMVKRNRFRNNYSLNLPENYQEQELNHIQNRIEICQEKKRVLDMEIEVETKESESLKIMVKMLERDERKEPVVSEHLTL